MRIGIDATGVLAGPQGFFTGLTYYTVHIVTNLLRIDRANQYFIYCLEAVPPQLAGSGDAAVLRVLRGRYRKLLQQLRLPLAAIHDSVDVMFFPWQSCPLFTGCKGVVTIHDLHPYVIPDRFAKVHSRTMHRTRMRSMINRVYWRRMLRIAARRMERIIAVSQTTRHDLQSIFRVPPAKVEVVYPGIDRQAFNTDSDGRDPALFRKQHGLPDRYILCLGTHAYKNVEGSLKAFSIIRRQHGSSVKLVVAGYRHFLGKDIVELVERLELGRDVIFTDFFPAATLKYLYQGGELLLFPSFYEGFGLPVLEAFACGIPVVTSRAGALPEVAGGAAVLVNPHDPEEMASAVAMLLNDPALKATKREEGFKRVQNFSWPEAARRTAGVFREVVVEA